MDLRTLLAAVLGVGLGLVLVAYPEAVVRAHTVGRMPRDRRGEFGTDGGAGEYRRVVQGIGVVVAALGVYFGATLVT